MQDQLLAIHSRIENATRFINSAYHPDSRRRIAYLDGIIAQLGVAIELAQQLRDTINHDLVTGSTAGQHSLAL